MLCYLLRRTACHNCSATVTTIRSHVNNIVCCLNDIQVMLNYNNGISVIGQTAAGFLPACVHLQNEVRLSAHPEYKWSFRYFVWLSSVASLILCASPPDSVSGRLSQLDIGKSDIIQCLNLSADRRHIFKECTVPLPPSCPAHHRYSFPYILLPEFPGYTVCRRRPHTAHTHPAENAFQS